MSGPRPVLLVLRALGLGDLLTAVPALRALARAFPRHERVLATSPALAPLAAATGAVHRVVAARPLVPIEGAPPRPGVAVNLHGRGPQSHGVLRALGPDRWLAFAHPAVPESAGGPRWREDEHEIHRWCRLLAESGIPADPDDLDLAVPGADPASARGATVIHPGAASPARRWPADRWAAVARAEHGAGHRVLVTGAAAERPIAEAVARLGGLPAASVLAGRTGLLDLARIVRASGRVLTNDTGVAHLATALRRPSVVLFGPVSPAAWGPPPDRPWHRALWTGSPGPRWSDRPDPGLLRIQVDDVLAALASLPTAVPA